MTKDLNLNTKLTELKQYLSRQKSFNSRAYPPGQHGQSKKGKPTDYGVQLQTKQKLKAYYGNIKKDSLEIFMKSFIKKIQLKT